MSAARPTFRLTVRGLPLVEDLTWEIPPGFVVLTGETGAGKSLILGTLEWVLGGRIPFDVLPEGERAVLTLEVDPVPAWLAAWLEQEGLPADAPVVIRRTLDLKRKRTQAHIQDVPVTVRLLRALGERLLSFHGQHDLQRVLDEHTHLHWVDRYGVPSDLLRQYREAYAAWKEAREALEEERARIRALEERRDWLAFQAEELEILQDPPDVWAEREQEATRWMHARELQEETSALENRLETLLQEVGEALHHLTALRRVDASRQGWMARMEGVETELRELLREVTQYREELSVDPEVLEQWMALRHQVQRLMEKYRTDYPGLLKKRKEVKEALALLDTSAHRLAEREARLLEAEKQVQQVAARLSDARKTAAERLAKRVRRHLKRLRLPNAQFEVRFTPVDPGPEGADQVQFLFAASPDLPLQPLARVASGGELSRVLLALHVEVARALEVEVLVFDEIDAGVGGDAAHPVGELLARLGRERTVLAITHWPQIAARAQVHDRVEKRSPEAQTGIHLQRLDGDARLEELVRMLGGDPSAVEDRAAARQLLDRDVQPTGGRG